MFSAERVGRASFGSAPKMIVIAMAALTLPQPLWPAQPDDPPRPAKTPGVVVARLCDNSSLKMTLREETVVIATRYGKLRIPIADIQQIDFATRTTPDVLKRIDAAVVNLGHAVFETREAADAELLALGEHAYSALLKAGKSSDVEVAKRANALVEKIREVIPEDMLEFRPHDVIHTTDTAKFIGQIEGVMFKASTVAFGDVPLKFASVRTLRVWGGEAEIDLAKLPPAPATMSNLATMIGKTFVFRVTGVNMGGIWGTDVYTDDSQLATVAVHAGIVKAGETGIIRVTIVAPPPGFTASTRNGVASNEYGAHPGAYKVGK
jgi:LCCL domain